MGEFNWKGFHLSRIHGPGLVNEKNDCFMNSVLQFVFHTPQIIRLIYYKRKNENICNHCNECIICVLHSYFIKINENINVLDPVKMRALVNTLIPGRIPKKQEDAHEMLSCLLEEIRFPTRIINGQKSWVKQDRATKKTGIEVIFGGRLISNLRCTNCSWTRENAENCLELNLSLTLIRYTRSPKLDDYIKAYFSTELMNNYCCPKCKKEETTYRKLVLDTQPKILIIQLERFQKNAEKICKEIDIPCDLNLDNYSTRYKGAKPADYKLYGFISHAGKHIHNGHYTATILGYDSKWYRFDDTLITPTEVIPELKYDDPYILFYYKVNVEAPSRNRPEQKISTNSCIYVE